MTVQAELENPGGRFEYILCIEGIGWPTDEATIASGFDGDVFVTNDFNGTLASILDCTVHKGLYLPTSMSDSFDPMTNRYSHGGMRFQVQDQDSWFMTNFHPL